VNSTRSTSIKVREYLNKVSSSSISSVIYHLTASKAITIVPVFTMLAKSLAIASVLSTALAGPPALLHTRSTLPDVTIKALPAGCASYPGYNADTKTAGPWSLIVSAAENPDLINFGPSTSYSLTAPNNDFPVMQWGFVSVSLSYVPSANLC
jgi:hypothetical protein